MAVGAPGVVLAGAIRGIARHRTLYLAQGPCQMSAGSWLAFGERLVNWVAAGEGKGSGDYLYRCAGHPAKAPAARERR
jgi:hypothetical protein